MDAKELIKTTAEILGKTEEQVLREIESRVRRCVKNPPKRDREYWAKVAPDGVLPPPEQIVERIVELARED